jgi:glycosyltransferase involved in cell wall biosynthesis
MLSHGVAVNRLGGHDRKTTGGLIFNENDVLISLGLDWDFDYYKDFYHFRTQHKIKVVTCCYDLIPVLYPQYCVGNVSNKFTSYFLDVADGSDLILCISKQSERDLNQMLEITGGARPPTFVFTLGDKVSQENSGTLSAEVSSVCQGKFILFVSTIERRKNHEVLYRAYHLLCRQGKSSELPKLVFVGMPGWGTAELLEDIELDPQTQDLIVQLNHVSDSELEHLYKSSLFCVFPSLYEGWGLPVAEALCFGKAVVCSDQGSLPEVGGDLVEYVKPWDPQAWADKIYLLSTIDAKRLEIEDRVKNNYRPKSWLRAATEIKNKIDELS